MTIKEYAKAHKIHPTTVNVQILKGKLKATLVKGVRGGQRWEIDIPSLPTNTKTDPKRDLRQWVLFECLHCSERLWSFIDIDSQDPPMAYQDCEAP